MARGVGQRSVERRRQTVDVAAVAHGVPEDLPQHREVTGDDRYPGGECFHRREPEPLLRRGEAEHLCAGDECWQLVVVDRPQHERADAELAGAGVTSGAVVAVVEERLPTTDDELQIAAVEPGEGLEQVDRALARLDATERQDVAAQPGGPGVAGGRTLGAGSAGEPARVDPVGNHRRAVAVGGLDLVGNRPRDADARGRGVDGTLVAGDQTRCREGVQVVDGADGRDAGVEHGIGRDAVLRVHDVRAGVEGRGQSRDGPLDAVTDALVLARDEGDDPHLHARVEVPEEGAVTAPSQGPDLDVVPAGRECLRQGERVDDPATGLGGVGELGDTHGSSDRAPPVTVRRWWW